MNALIGEKGLECRVRLPCLIVDQQRNRVKAPGGVSEAASSSDESESELEMDRRLRRSRGVKGRRRSRQTQKPPGLPSSAHSSAKVHSAAREEEEVKVQTARDDSGSESEDDDKEQGKQPADTALIEVCVVRTRIGVIMFYHDLFLLLLLLFPLPPPTPTSSSSSSLSSLHPSLVIIQITRPLCPMA